MNFLSTYARILPRILLDRQMHSFHLNHGFLKNFNSIKLVTFTEPSRLFSFTSINREEAAVEGETRVERRKRRKIEKDPSKDRSVSIPVETSIRYMKSNAYRECYGNDPVWKHYRRNHRGNFPPSKTRKLCVRGTIVSTGNPCPICRDEYLVVDHTNLDLLKQFISPTSGELISYSVTGVCQLQHHRLVRAFNKAKDLGTVSFDVPFRQYDYSEYTETL
ncbi:hypothetical protein V9T40_008662 [Parthenolecanium corni]|uniref:Small ribosomal subunit protein mS40 n=1 Tax=Parthenolecanium corni TaxID=536013 RepID=A0AAN9Y6T5_9HEMI